MATNKTIDEKVLQNILTEADRGIADKSRNIDHIADSKTKQIIKNGSDAVIKNGGGGASAAVIAATATTTATIIAAALGSSAAATTAATAIGGTAALNAMGGVALSSIGGAATLLGGPVVWTAAGVALIIGTLIGKAVGKQKERGNSLAKEIFYRESTASNYPKDTEKALDMG